MQMVATPCLVLLLLQVVVKADCKVLLVAMVVQAVVLRATSQTTMEQETHHQHHLVRVVTAVLGIAQTILMVVAVAVVQVPLAVLRPQLVAV
jgi:hypothetical protein